VLARVDHGAHGLDAVTHVLGEIVVVEPEYVRDLREVAQHRGRGAVSCAHDVAREQRRSTQRIRA
jgi:hypothetical protein